MRLLFIIPEFPPHGGGGIVTFYGNLLPELARQGHQVHAIVGSAFTSRLQGYESGGVRVEFLDHDVVSSNLSHFETLRPLPQLQRHLAAAWTAHQAASAGDGYDLVETVDWGLLFIPWVLDDSAPPTVVQLHGSAGQIDYHDPKRGDELFGCVIRLLEMQVLRAADGLQSYSAMNAREWETITGRPVSCIPPAWNPPAPQVDSGPRSEHALAVGRIQYWKGPMVLCEALRLLGGSAPVVDWIGRDMPFDSGNSMSAHVSQAFPDVWGVKVRPLGSCPLEEVAARQARAAFSVVPSVWDVFNFTCVEAMGGGQVVICSTGAGASGLIIDGENGLLFPANDPQALAAKIEQVLSMPPGTRARMGRAARATIISTLNPATVAARRIEEYEALVARGRSPQQLHSWVSDAVRPRASLGDALGFLDNLPLREISQYTIRRGLRRAFN